LALAMLADDCCLADWREGELFDNKAL